MSPCDRPYVRAFGTCIYRCFVPSCVAVTVVSSVARSIREEACRFNEIDEILSFGIFQCGVDDADEIPS